MPATDIKQLVDAAHAAFAAGSANWIATSADVTDYFLNVLPPIYGPGKFACCEPYTTNSQGQEVYLAFRNVDYDANTAEARYLTRREIGAT